MRISDWSSDVCSSVLGGRRGRGRARAWDGVGGASAGRSREVGGGPGGCRTQGERVSAVAPVSVPGDGAASAGRCVRQPTAGATGSPRSEERRVGNEGVRTGRSRGSGVTTKKKK